MKKIVFTMCLFLLSITMSQAQSFSKETTKEARKAEKEVRKAKEKLQNEWKFKEAVQALKDHAFVMEADRVMFRRGRSAFVSSTTNFVSLNDEKATVQVAFNGANSGPNSLGGVTVDGYASNIQYAKDKKGNITFSMNVSGVGVSARVVIHLSKESNQATAEITPNFNSNRITLSGRLLPIKNSNTFKGMSY
ncbi:MAG: DUF4251 domain-containing protein [Bacteroidaceae bacterium]